jgi:hypothetical protein
VTNTAPTYVRYLDHLLYRSINHNCVEPVVRELVGWVAKENSDAIWIVFDRSVGNVANEASQAESGLVLLKSDILEMRRIG